MRRRFAFPSSAVPKRWTRSVQTALVHVMSLIVAHIFWAPRVPCFRGSPKATSPVQNHRESMRFSYWRACFRGVPTRVQMLGGCPESMAPNPLYPRHPY